MFGTLAHKLAVVAIGAALFFLIGCTPGSSSSSSDSSSSSAGSALTSSPIALNGDVNDPSSDPNDGDANGDNPLVGDSGNESTGDGASASVPEPATGLLFLSAAGSMALARLRARKRS
jgi:hypothetical protein